MDWNGTFRTFVSGPEPSVNFIYNYNYDQFPGMEMKHNNPAGVLAEAAAHGMVPDLVDKNIIRYNNINNQEKKKRLTSDQLDSLERSFQEEIKLDPDRKMKLSRDLGLQPRQIAVWFQNRRARWKNKQLERLYDSLKREYDVVFREKQKLQDEVMKLKGMLREQVPTRNQVSAAYTEISGEETVESTSIRSSNNPRVVANHHHPITECNHLFNVDGLNPISSSSPYWGVNLPAYP